MLLLLAILTGYVFAGPFITQHPLQPLSFGKPMPLRDPGLDLCPTCISFAEQFINDLLNIILSKAKSVAVRLVATSTSTCIIIRLHVHPTEHTHAHIPLHVVMYH